MGARDITERKLAEETGRLPPKSKVSGCVWITSSPLFRESSGKHGASRTRPTQRMNFVSDYVERMLGYSVEDG